MPTDYTLDVVAPALKEIYAPFSMPLSLDTICHSALTEIQFRGILWGKTCQLWHYQHLFSSAPCLERITLCGAAFQQSMAPAPIHLPNLRSLQLYQVSYSLIGVLLSSIIASPSWHPTIKIWIEAFTGLAEDIFPPSPLPSSLLSTIYCSNRLSIDAPDWNQYRLKVGIELPDRDMGLMYIKFDGGLFGLREISARLARIVCCSQLEILELNGSETFHSQISRHVVPVVPNLETLRIRSRRVENPSDFSFLRSVILDISCVDVSAFEQPICLKLRHVTLDLGQLDLGVVGQLILGRTSGHDSQIGSSKLPCKLEVVEVPDDIGLQMDPLGEEVQQIAARHGVELRYRKFST
ncbi:hypothetical protein FRC02_012396 [Tulasnella sp. 418]|nr:hypothetical protein FRC02_012396 [Tulasnella sp. 418]